MRYFTFSNYNKWLLSMTSMLSITTLLTAQTTSIPDQFFEQTLINLGIDSDGVINGQVLTSDIEIVITLDLSNSGIEDLTGIEDFTALEFIDLSELFIFTGLDLSNNIQLKEIYADSSIGSPFFWPEMDISQNINLTEIFISNLICEGLINLKNENNLNMTVFMPCKADLGIPCNVDANCVMVDDEVSANNNEPPYSGWLIQADFVYSEDCILGIADNKEKQFSVFPNPTKETITISNTKNIEPFEINIYSMQGQLLQTQHQPINGESSINVSSYSPGIYFVSIKSDNGVSEVVRFIKE